MEVQIVRISESGNSAMVGIKTNERNFGNTLAYVGLTAEEKEADLKKGDTIVIPSDFSLVTKEDENGETLCYKNGEAIKFVEFA